ncbi:MAG: ATP-grasp domain-containing protein [Clostridia bacterium]|nr:ATP-grasp domain-containing protein [Clostridia bacterium]
MTTRQIFPVLLGADLNCYSVARAFHEAYGACSRVFGKDELGAIKHSKIVSFSKIPPLEERETVLRVLIDFAVSTNEKPYIISCTDEYALFIIENQDILSKYYICECPKIELFPTISDKTEFYRECGRLGLPYPESVFVSSPNEAGKARYLPFDYPAIVKPSCSFEYWKHPFDRMKKVYVARSAADAERIVDEIFSSGYDKQIIVQKMIRGEKQYVATCFSVDGAVLALSVGRVLLGEITPKGIGNHVAIITEQNDTIESMVTRFLDAEKYTGFSNFDIMYDENKGKYYLLEINPRQGRSNYYMSASGMNIARLYVEKIKYPPCENEIFWHSVPTNIVTERCSSSDAKKIKQISKNKKSFSPLCYPADMRDIRRITYLAAHHFGFYLKYRDYDKR